MKFQKSQSRFLLKTFHSRILESNPLHSPSDRTISIYLPPRYFKTPKDRFPVVYFLHGYDGHAGNWIIMPDLELFSWQPVKILMKTIGNGVNINEVPTFHYLDQLIAKNIIPPCIIVQPDASLHIPVRGGIKGLDGARATKGSFYVDSSSTGNYASYIVNEIIHYIDSQFRTLPDRAHRVLMGGSMGGYGALYLGAEFSSLFSAIGALSPANALWNLCNWKLVVPIIQKVLGPRLAQKYGNLMFQDILETQDLIFSPNQPLIPTLKFDKLGKLKNFDADAMENWRQFDLTRIYKSQVSKMESLKIWLSCDSEDEYGLAPFAIKMKQTLDDLGFNPQFAYGHDPRTELSPHIFGIAFNIVPALRFCTSHF